MVVQEPFWFRENYLENNIGNFLKLLFQYYLTVFKTLEKEQRVQDKDLARLGSPTFDDVHRRIDRQPALVIQALGPTWLLALSFLR